MLMDKVLALKTNDKVLAAFKQAASRKITAAEVMEQRVSFVYGSMSKAQGVTKDHVRQVIREQAGGTVELAQ